MIGVNGKRGLQIENIFYHIFNNIIVMIIYNNIIVMNNDEEF